MFLTLIAALVAQAPPAPAVVCVITPGFEAWFKARPSANDFAIGRAADVAAMPVANVRLAVQPSKPLTGAYVATSSFTVATAGTYRVAVGGEKAKLRPVWLDIAGSDGKPLKSAAHTHGGPCHTITKIVDFNLTPGKYTFLATGLTAADAVRVLIVPKT